MTNPSEAMLKAAHEACRGAAFADDRVFTVIYTAMQQAATPAAPVCPSCGGLNIRCPDGCGRDPKTGELNGTRLEQAATPAAPVQDDDAEWLRAVAEDEEGVYSPIEQERCRRLAARLTPPLVEALRGIRDLSSEGYDSDRAWALGMKLRARLALKGTPDA